MRRTGYRYSERAQTYVAKEHVSRDRTDGGQREGVRGEVSCPQRPDGQHPYASPYADLADVAMNRQK